MSTDAQEYCGSNPLVNVTLLNTGEPSVSEVKERRGEDLRFETQLSLIPYKLSRPSLSSCHELAFLVVKN